MSVATSKTHHDYLPAAGRDLFLPLYDVVTKLMGADRARYVLLEQSELREGERVLDIGCGTGTLALLLKQKYPEAQVVGLDPDPRALARAGRKAERASASVQFDQGYANALSYADSSFDHVYSTYMFHHLESAQREQMLREVRRVLKPGGILHLMDFGGASDGGRGLSRWFHAHDRLKDNNAQTILELMRSAGLTQARVVGSRKLLGGLATVVYYEAS